MHASSLCAVATTGACFALLRMPAQTRTPRKGGKFFRLFGRRCVCLLKLAPHRPSAENADKLSAFSWRSATARQQGDLMLKLAPHRPPACTGRPSSAPAPVHALTCRPLVARVICCSHVYIPKGDFPEISVPSAPPPLAPHRPSSEKEDKLSSFSGHNATARYVGATTVACVALLRMRYRVRCGVCAYARCVSPLRCTHLSFRHRRFELSR